MNLWALIFFTMARTASPQYVELYPSKEACVAKIPDQGVFSGNPRAICVPITGVIPK